MDTCDVLIVGGGPAGSSCAWKLRRAGLDVIVADAAMFPRDKVCAGWITPQVVTELDLDIEEYPRGRTFQPVGGFRVGLIGDREEIETTYGRPVSYGIRRCEFDQYLLQRSGARLSLGMPITSIRKNVRHWIVNDAIRAAMLVGAGGHFCPVARSVTGLTSGAPLVVAQEAEFPIDCVEGESCPVERAVPELYFCRDLLGYGWCIRKGEYLNVGLGRLDHQALPAAMSQFVAFLQARRKIPRRPSWRWRGHAYSLYDRVRRRVTDDAVLLVGDAAGLACPQSGEGIRPAIESGLLAAATIIEANGQYTRNRLKPYEERLQGRLGTGTLWRAPSWILPSRLKTALAHRLLETPAFVRHVVLDRWFLHRHEPALGTHPSN